MKPAAFLGTKLRHLSAILDAAVQEHYDKVAVPFRPRFFPVAKALQNGPAGIGELAKRIGVSQPAMTQTVSEMKRAGLIAPVASEDRRVRLIHLSPFGREVVQRLTPLWDAIDTAAEELDREVSRRLSLSIDATLQALETESFYSRISKHLDAPNLGG